MMIKTSMKQIYSWQHHMGRRWQILLDSVSSDHVQQRRPRKQRIAKISGTLYLVAGEVLSGSSYIATVSLLLYVFFTFSLSPIRYFPFVLLLTYMTHM